MLCYQVTARFSFINHKAMLVSTNIKKLDNAQVHLVLSGFTFGSGLKICRFFLTKTQAAQYVSYLNKVYKNRKGPVPSPAPAGSGGQLSLF
jgi:hypothetical protein